MLTRSNWALIVVILCLLFSNIIVAIRVGTEQQRIVQLEEQMETYDFIMDFFQAKQECEFYHIPWVQLDPPEPGDIEL